MSFVKIDMKDFNVNPFEMIGKKWYLITAGQSAADYNTMTASWGSFGVMWGKNVFTCGIRTNRHTFGYAEENEYFTACFFDEKYRDVLKFCGTKSGRDYDKAKETGITPFEIDGAIAFEEASTIIVCRKMYAQFLEEQNFIDKSALSFYEKDPYHKIYTSEIVGIYVKQ